MLDTRRIVIAWVMLTSGCPTVGTPSGDGDADQEPDGDARADADHEDDADAAGDARPDVDFDVPPILETVLIYAHSRDTLYAFSPYTNSVDEIGPFTLAGGNPAPYMLDLAIDGEGEVYTSSDTSLFRVDPETAHVIEIGEFGLGEEQLYALTFLPPGVYASDRETLIGATNEGAYYSVDVSNAQPRYLGTYPDGWQSSGDIVSIAGLGTFATVKRVEQPDSPDVLVQMTFGEDGSTQARVLGSVVEGERPYRQIFGLGYWGRALYGFTNTGELVEIDRESGAGRLVSETTGAEQFWGAGVTTVVPVVY